MTDHVSTQTAVTATLPDATQIAVDQLPTGELVQLIKLYDGTPDSVNAAIVTPAGALKVDGSAVTQPVSAAALPLPAGAATSAKQDSLLTELQLKAKLTDTQPVSAAALPLPTGPATGAKQDTGNTSLASIDTKTPTLVTGRVPVDGSGVTQPVSAASLPLPSGASTETTLALIKAKTDNIDVLLSTRTKPADSQHVTIDSSASIGVTGPLTDTQLRANPVPVSNASLPLPAGAATEATLALGATSAKQDTALTTLNAIDTDLKAEIGSVGTIPGAYTVLDRLNQIGAKIDAARSTNATEATLKKLLAALSKPVSPSYSTLLHR